MNIEQRAHDLATATLQYYISQIGDEDMHDKAKYLTGRYKELYDWFIESLKRCDFN
jgi:hypothetical protein